MTSDWNKEEGDYSCITSEKQCSTNTCGKISIPGGTTKKNSRCGVLFVWLEQRTGRANLALCPRFDSWWHHEELPMRSSFCLVYNSFLLNIPLLYRNLAMWGIHTQNTVYNDSFLSYISQKMQSHYIQRCNLVLFCRWMVTGLLLIGLNPWSVSHDKVSLKRILTAASLSFRSTRYTAMRRHTKKSASTGINLS